MLGRYEILKHLAQGGMAELLLARTVGIEGFERHVVLKRIRAEAARDERYVSMFLDEARLAASLHHHNIVQVTDIGQEAGEYFFTMEYVHGEDTRALLANASKHGQMVPLEHVIGIVCAAAAGLHHAHEQRGANRAPLGLVHRDVSPANILIGYDGGVKVADFGIAKAKGTKGRAETESGTLKGKVAYMSPEQCVGEAMDRRSDVFSLGIVLYELCTVRRLFKGDNDFLTMTSIVLGYIPPPSTIRPDLPPELEDIILKALAAKPEDRYQTTQELRLALEQVAGALGLTILNTALADYMKRTFGERPEPWLDDDDLEIELSVDFDGSRSGVVSAPLEGMASIESARLVALSRPAAHPRSPTRAMREPEIVEADNAEGELDVQPEIVEADNAESKLDEPAPILSSTTAASPIPHRSRARMIIGMLAAVGSLCAFAAALWLSRGTPIAEEPVPARALAPMSAPIHEPPAPPRQITTPTPSPTPVAKPAAAKPLKKIKPAPSQAAKKKWDPNSLFLE